MPKALLARFGQDFVLGQPLQPLPGAGRQALREADHLGMRIHAQNEIPVPLVPSIQVGRVCKIRIAADCHRPGDGPHQIRGAVDPFNAPAMTGRLPRAVEQIEHFLGIGQADNQRRVAPDPFIGQTDSLLTFTLGPGDRPIHINERFL